MQTIERIIKTPNSHHTLPIQKTTLCIVDNRNYNNAQLKMIKAIRAVSTPIQRIPIYRVEQDEDKRPTLSVNIDNGIDYINPEHQLNVSIGYPDHVPVFGEDTQDVITFDLNNDYWTNIFFPMIKKQGPETGVSHGDISLNDPGTPGFKIEIPSTLVSDFIANITPGTAQSTKKTDFVASLNMGQRASDLLDMIYRTIQVLPESKIRKRNRVVRGIKEILSDQYYKAVETYNDAGSDDEYQLVIEDMWDKYNKALNKILGERTFNNDIMKGIAGALIPLPAQEEAAVGEEEKLVDNEDDGTLEEK